MPERFKVSDDEVVTLAMYNKFPAVLSGHFASFRGLPGIHPAAEDLRMAQSFAGVGVGDSRVVEMGCGDGRDAEDFLPLSGKYIGVGPAEGELELARQRFPDAPEDTFQLGRAQDYEYPVGTNVIMSVNAILHVPTEDLEQTYENMADGLTTKGVAHVITKARDEDTREVYPDNFDDCPETLQMPGRVFYEHSRRSLLGKAEKAGLVVVHKEITYVHTKPWDWFSFIIQKP